MNQTNGAHGTTAQATTPAWEPEGPFLNPPQVSLIGTPARESRPVRRGIESPFTAEYAGEDARPSPHAEAFATLVDELHDEEFAEALEDLVNEASALLEEGFSGELADPGRERVAMERTVRNYLQPLERTTEALLDRMADELGEKDLSVLSEDEVDSLLESYTPPGELSPAFEGFLRGIIRKATKAVKKVASIANLPHRLVLNRLRGLVRPLLNRVLKQAINRLPVSLRPIAGQLARKFLGTAVDVARAPVPQAGPSTPPMSPAPTTPPTPPTAPDSDTSDGAGVVDDASSDPGQVEEELNVRLAGYMLAGEAFEAEVEAEQIAASLAEAEHEGTLQQLDRARQVFAESVVRHPEGEEPTQLVEQFVPAILPALKIGIKVVGRPRVVKFLSSLVARFIRKYVGPQQASTLSTALVDTGLRLISLEAVEGEAAIGGHALAATVEDTVTRVARMAPPEAWENEELLEAYVQEAFLESASAHFPDSLIRDELHESANASGAWVAMPVVSARKRYKKYTRVFDATITPQILDTVKTFGGTPLGAFIRDRLGIAASRPVRARVHLYEAIPGTRLSLIALHEKGVAGLGNGRRGAWSLFHPLTPDAAGLLLNEPRLGAPSPDGALARRRAAVGQRFYYLEIPGARVRIAPRRNGRSGGPARSSRTRMRLDFVRRQLRVALFYSEADAQGIVTLLRQKAPTPVLLRALKSGREAQVGTLLTSPTARGLRLVHEAAPTEELAAPIVRSILSASGTRLSALVHSWILAALQRQLQSSVDRFAAEFERAAQSDEDGVTIVLTFDAPQLFGALRSLVPGARNRTAVPLPAQAANISVEVRAGFATR